MIGALIIWREIFLLQKTTNWKFLVPCLAILLYFSIPCFQDIWRLFTPNQKWFIISTINTFLEAIFDVYCSTRYSLKENIIHLVIRSGGRYIAPIALLPTFYNSRVNSLQISWKHGIKKQRNIAKHGTKNFQLVVLCRRNMALHIINAPIKNGSLFPR